MAIAQSSRLNGRVVDAATGEALPYASVYFNSTTNGTTTDLEGEFSISVNPSFTELIISFLGYRTITYQIDPTALNRPYKFEMILEGNRIQEVEVVSKRSDKWYMNLATFTRDFIGSSSLAKKTTILNPEVLQFDLDDHTNVFSARARDKLIIENEALGYRLEYDLQSYQHDLSTSRLIILGYPRFIEMEGKKRKKKRWAKNRKKAFLGSHQHFLKSIYDGTVQEEGFEIRRLVKKPNPNRPDEESISNAREVMRSFALSGKSSEIPDSIRATLRASRRSKTVSYLDKRIHDYRKDITTRDDKVDLVFTDYWQVTYTNEKEDYYYVRPGQIFDANRSPGNQISLISLKTEMAEINSAGILKDPLSLLFEEYWAFEKIGDLLPLDYTISNKN